MSETSFSAILTPNNLSISDNLKLILLFSLVRVPSDITFEFSPPQSVFIISVAISRPISLNDLSIPLSFLYLASEFIPKSRPVCAIFILSQVTASTRTFTVPSSLPELFPPIIPAIDSGPLSSANTTWLLFKMYSLSSNANIFSASFAFLISRKLLILS